MCGKISADNAFTDDAFNSASAWLEVNHLPVDAFIDRDKWVSTYLKMDLSGSVKGSFNMMKCTLLSQSQDAKSLYEKYKKSRN
ncbi:T6SS amidase immunity protein Tai4 family protein [uncultured Pantoea sp.]|uniref:T6SS amidase immunity protein Tai4 family protein n=1 Tax=unclassified Pantoea TaxID=2630326 RepID=UPI0025864EF9|nr:T6SS amidase immunity protein Tai4 family protein [uncultured Pantoea sp.]